MPKSTDLLHLQLAQLPRSQDSGISVSMHNDDNRTNHFTHMYACGVKLIGTPVTCCNVAMTANLHPYNYVVGHNSVLYVDQYIISWLCTQELGHAFPSLRLHVRPALTLQLIYSKI